MPNIEGGSALPIVLSQDAPDGSLSALPVYWTADRPNQGGPALPVKVLLDSDLLQNGGRYRIEGRPQALPVFVAPAGTPVLGQRPVPVYAINRNIWYRERLKSLFGSSIIGYWPGNENSGLVALDYSGRGFNGVYTGVTLGQPGIGDGLTCPLYDGVADFMQPPAGFRTAFNPQAGTVLCLIKNNIAWADATARGFIRIGVDANNLVALQKQGANSVTYNYIAGGTSKTVTRITTETIFSIFGMTWDISADQLIAYFGGLQTGLTQSGLGVWVGTPVANLTVIGALTATPTGVWDGWETHIVALNRAATPAEMAAAAVI
jgi:hypothetical protein